MQEFKWKTINQCKSQLVDMKVQLESYIKINESDIIKQFDIACDISHINHLISQLDNVEKSVASLNKKYGWDK